MMSPLDEYKTQAMLNSHPADLAPGVSSATSARTMCAYLPDDAHGGPARPEQDPVFFRSVVGIRFARTPPAATDLDGQRILLDGFARLFVGRFRAVNIQVR